MISDKGKRGLHLLPEKKQSMDCRTIDGKALWGTRTLKESAAGGAEALYAQERLIADINETLQNRYGKHDLYAKTIGGISLEELITADALYLSAIRASRGFMDKRDTLRYMEDPYGKSLHLRDEVLSGRFRPKYYRERVIRERGKERLIKPPTFECKVVQKCICDYLIRPILEPRMISTSYASIRGRGTEKMYRDILSALHRREQEKDAILVMTDFTGYFASIHNDTLFAMLGRYIQDVRILALMRLFSPDERGLSLGNELSQVPASFYPSPVDHYMKDRLGFREYFRYMDDTLCILKDQEAAEAYIETFIAEAKKLKLTVNREKIRIVPMGRSFVFCKERFLYNRHTQSYYRMMNPAIYRNEKRKLLAFERIYREQDGDKGGGQTDDSRKEASGRNRTLAERYEAQYRAVRGMIASKENTGIYLAKLDAIYEKVRRVWTKDTTENNG